NQSSSRRSNTSSYNASLEWKWWSRLGRRIPTPPAMSARDVPSYPCSAKRCRASVRISSRVEGGSTTSCSGTVAIGTQRSPNSPYLLVGRQWYADVHAVHAARRHRGRVRCHADREHRHHRLPPSEPVAPGVDALGARAL